MCVFVEDTHCICHTLIIPVLTGSFLACIRHSCLCLELCFETVRMCLKVTQSIGGAVKSFFLG